jgi:hypothetical protein
MKKGQGPQALPRRISFANRARRAAYRTLTRLVLTRWKSGFFRIEASSAAGSGGGASLAAGGMPPIGAAQPQPIGALHESQLSQQLFLPQFQWANHCLHFLHFGLQQTELVHESAQEGGAPHDGADTVQPQSEACPQWPLPHAPLPQLPHP